MPAFGGAQINIGGSTKTPAPDATPTKTGGAFGGMNVSLGGGSTTPPAPVVTPSPVATTPVEPTIPLPTNIKPLNTADLFQKSAQEISTKQATVDPNQTFIGPDPGTGKPMTEFQSFLANIPLFNVKSPGGKPNQAINSKPVMAISNAWDAFSSRAKDFASSLTAGPMLDPTKTYDPGVQARFEASGKDAEGNPIDSYGNRTVASTPLERAAKGTGVAVSAVNLAISPISGTFKAAEDIPVAGRAVHAFNWTVGELGDLATKATYKAVDMIPSSILSDKNKETIKGPLGEVAALAAQMYVGKVAAEKGLPLLKEKTAEINTKLTKDIIDHTVPGKTVTIEPGQVRDILTGVLDKGEERDLYLSLGRDASKIKTDIKQGVSIDVPKSTFQALVDKPYWAKIKGVFGFPESDPILFNSQSGPTNANPLVRYLPAPGEATPEILKTEIQNALESHGEDATLQALHDNLGVAPTVATKLINEAKADLALKAPEKFLQLNAPAGGQIERPTKAFAGTKIEVNKTPEEKAIEQKVITGIKENGGVTIDTNGSEPTKGYSYAPDKTTEYSVPEKDFHANPEKHISDFIEKNKDLLSQDGNHIGGWVDGGRVYLDVSKVGEPTPETIAKAQEAKQLGVYDLEHGKTITTGQLAENGKGEYTPIDEANNVYDQHQREISGANKEGGTGGSEKIQSNQETGGGANQEKLKPVGGGEKVASELSSGIEARAIEKKLADKPFSSLSMHERAVMEEQRDAATKLYAEDKERAIRIATEGENAPQGMLASVIYQKVVSEAEKDGNIDLMMKLATSPFNEEITAMAQHLRGLAEFRNKTSPTEIIKKVSKERKAIVEKKTTKAGSIEQAKEKVVERGRRAIKKRSVKSPLQLKQVDDFISLMEC